MGNWHTTDTSFPKPHKQSVFIEWVRIRGSNGSETINGFSRDLVPENGVEPSRPCGHRILSPARLPVPPLGHGDRIALPDFSVQFPIHRLQGRGTQVAQGNGLQNPSFVGSNPTRASNNLSSSASGRGFELE